MFICFSDMLVFIGNMPDCFVSFNQHKGHGHYETHTI